MEYENKTKGMDEKFLIPIDDAIDAFKHHLDSHDRTILSAQFGDGKTFFLSHFVENEDVKERYHFLTIFPVNYQVLENRDIFELIKRDILLQMLITGVIETELEVSDAQALALYFQCQPLSFIESFFPLMTELDPTADSTKAVAVALAGKKLLSGLKKKIDKIKQGSRDWQIEQFLDAVERNPAVGQDAISCIILQGIEQYKKRHPNKRIALVIEDMDRIDPAHLFRILNVFSAHIDYSYHLGGRPDDSLNGNKFGLDKVIFVLHYENLKKIYRHFYGVDTSFEGYIEKFCSSTHFSYSLQKQSYDYYMKQISKETGMESKLINYFIKTDDFNNKSVRKVVNAIERTGDFIIDITTVKNREGGRVPLHPGILRLIAIMRKLDISDDNIVNRLKSAIVTKDATTNNVFLYVGPYLTYIKYQNALGDLRYAESTDITNYVHVDNVDAKGRAQCTFSTSMNYEPGTEERLTKLLYKLLQMVAK